MRCRRIADSTAPRRLHVRECVLFFVFFRRARGSLQMDAWIFNESRMWVALGARRRLVNVIPYAFCIICFAKLESAYFQLPLMAVLRILIYFKR